MNLKSGTFGVVAKNSRDPQLKKKKLLKMAQNITINGVSKGHVSICVSVFKSRSECLVSILCFYCVRFSLLFQSDQKSICENYAKFFEEWNPGGLFYIALKL